MIEIIVDDRERHIINHLKKITGYFFRCVVQRLYVGDYIIVQNGRIIICIERKTWVDLAAGFRDGRKNNIHKMLKFQQDTQCKLAYLIEGNPRPNLTKLYGRIPAKNLIAYLDHIMIQENIHVIYSLNNIDTANRLMILAQNISTIKWVNQLNGPESAKSESKSASESLTSSISAAQSTLYSTKKQINPVIIQEQLLMCLPSIGSMIAPILVESKISLYELYHKTYSIDQIAKIKFANGALIGTKRANRIYNNSIYLKQYSDRTKKVQLRILSTIPGISKHMAQIIYNHIRLKEIFEGTFSFDNICNIQCGKIRFGKKRTSDLLMYLLDITHDELQKLIC